MQSHCASTGAERRLHLVAFDHAAVAHMPTAQVTQHTLLRIDEQATMGAHMNGAVGERRTAVTPNEQVRDLAVTTLASASLIAAAGALAHLSPPPPPAAVLPLTAPPDAIYDHRAMFRVTDRSTLIRGGGPVPRNDIHYFWDPLSPH